MVFYSLCVCVCIESVQMKQHCWPALLNRTLCSLKLGTQVHMFTQCPIYDPCRKEWLTPRACSQLSSHCTVLQRRIPLKGCQSPPFEEGVRLFKTKGGRPFVSFSGWWLWYKQVYTCVSIGGKVCLYEIRKGKAWCSVVYPVPGLRQWSVNDSSLDSKQASYYNAQEEWTQEGIRLPVLVTCHFLTA